MKARHKILLRNFLIEIVIYAILVSVYFWAVLQYLGLPLNQLFNLNPLIYALVTLLLIVVQSVFLEWFTSFLVTRLGLEKME